MISLLEQGVKPGASVVQLADKQANKQPRPASPGSGPGSAPLGSVLSFSLWPRPTSGALRTTETAEPPGRPERPESLWDGADASVGARFRRRRAFRATRGPRGRLLHEGRVLARCSLLHPHCLVQHLARVATTSLVLWFLG
ncbi:uncharacterized protein LOC105301940 isoform X3 [Pteropus vampyrus]|uniref:Uncharacterized protein LOC105301940 isoform X3 n=1 Tax=Pteropus vampyrus TaxID=132908 RepID=A0A6P6BLX7_PTEVA|nr:uncharacterized protein LOC105301940 isoform X3 [Pteropus vampyrus]